MRMDWREGGWYVERVELLRVVFCEGGEVSEEGGLGEEVLLIRDLSSFLVRKGGGRG